MNRRVGPVVLWANKHSPIGFRPRYVAGVTLERERGPDRRLKVMVE